MRPLIDNPRVSSSITQSGRPIVCLCYKAQPEVTRWSSESFSPSDPPPIRVVLIQQRESQQLMNLCVSPLIWSSLGGTSSSPSLSSWRPGGGRWRFEGLGIFQFRFVTTHYGGVIPRTLNHLQTNSVGVRGTFPPSPTPPHHPDRRRNRPLRRIC